MAEEQELVTFTGGKSNEICQRMYANDLTRPALPIQQQSGSLLNFYAEMIENLRDDQLVNSEAIKSLAESVGRISTVISQLQVLSENNTELNRVILEAQPAEVGKANKLGNVESGIVMEELLKSYEDGNLNQNKLRMEENTLVGISQIKASDPSLSINYQLTENNNKATYAEVVSLRSNCPSRPKAPDNTKTTSDNNHAKSDSLIGDGFNEVERKRKRSKRFFLSGIDENVKESQICPYLAEKNIVLSKVSMFQSKRRGTISVKIHIPSDFSSLVLSENFWPKFICCKLWEQKGKKLKTLSQEGNVTLGGTYSTYVLWRTAEI